MTSKNTQVQEHLDFILIIILITFLIFNIFAWILQYFNWPCLFTNQEKNRHFIQKKNKIKVWGGKFSSRKIQNIVYLIFFNADVNLIAPPPPGAYTVGKGGLIRRGGGRCM